MSIDELGSELAHKCGVVKGLSRSTRYGFDDSEREALSVTADAVVELLLQKFSLESDATTLALRLLGEGEETFSPETAEVMSRWRPVCLRLLQGGEDSKAVEKSDE
jgi:hypothetical protein